MAKSKGVSSKTHIREQLNEKVVHNVTTQFDSVKHMDRFHLDMIKIFLNSSTVAMYRYWYRNKKKISMDDAINAAANLIKNGLESSIK